MGRPKASWVLTGLFGVMSGLVGIVLFVSPRWAAREFPWAVSDFVAMTTGGWCLGNAFAAGVVVRERRWETSFGVTGAALVYIGRFDFSAHPGQLAYIAAYVVVGVAVVVVLPRYRQ